MICMFGKNYEVANTTLIKCAMPAAGYAYAIIPSFGVEEKVLSYVTKIHKHNNNL